MRLEELEPLVEILSSKASEPLRIISSGSPSPRKRTPTVLGFQNQGKFRGYFTVKISSPLYSDDALHRKVLFSNSEIVYPPVSIKPDSHRSVPTQSHLREERVDSANEVSESNSR